MTKLIHKHKDTLFSMVDMKATERRLIDLILANNYRLDGFEADKFYYFSADSYAKALEIPEYEAYRDIKELVTDMYKATKVEKDVQTGITYFRRYIVEMSFDEKSRQVGVKWNPSIIPLISGEFEPGAYFTTTDKICLTSSSPRHAFAEYIISRKGELRMNGFIKVKLSYLREKLRLVDKYPIFADFRKRVIEPTVEDLLSNADLRLKVSYIKVGRVVGVVKFEEVR